MRAAVEGSGRLAQLGVGGRRDRLVDLAVEDVLRQAEDDGALRRLGGDLEGAPH